MTPEGYQKKENFQEECADHNSTVSQAESCSRCGGLLVYDYCTDLQDDTGTISFVAKRCTQCGNLIDPVIVQNQNQPITSIVVRGPHRRATPIAVPLTTRRASGYHDSPHKKLQPDRTQKENPSETCSPDQLLRKHLLTKEKPS